MNIYILTAILTIALTTSMITVHAQQAQTTGSLTVPATCGIQFFDSGPGNRAPIEYGTLSPGITSADQYLQIGNTGTASSQLFVTASHWEDSFGVPQMDVGRTHFGYGAINIPYDPTVPAPPSSTERSSLSTSMIPVTGPSGFQSGAIGPILTTWMVKVVLLDPFFSGSLTQEMNFTATC